MIRKRSAENTKEDIKQVATRLFLDKGYDGTTMQMIGDELGIVKSVISYHFKSKASLASSIFEDYILFLLKFITANPPENMNAYLLHSIIHICLYREVISDIRLQRLFFHKEIFSLWFHEKLTMIEGFIRDVSQEFRKDLSDEEIHYAAIMNQGAKQSLFEAYSNKPDDFTVDQFCYHYVYLLGLFSKLDELTIQKNISRAFSYADCMHIPNMELPCCIS